MIRPYRSRLLYSVSTFLPAIRLNRFCVDFFINAKIKFANIVPYSNLSYFIEDRKQRLNFSANFGIEVVQLSGVSVDLEGEVGELLMQQDGVISKLHEEIRNKFEAHYLVPVIQMNLNYLFN